MTENIVTGKKYRVLADAANKVWNRISLWSKASDTEFNDGKTAETKLGAINGITSDVNCEDETVAASAAMVNQLNSKIDKIQQVEIKKLCETNSESPVSINLGEDKISNYKYLMLCNENFSENYVNSIEYIPVQYIKYGWRYISAYQNMNSRMKVISDTEIQIWKEGSIYYCVVYGIR